ncbi:Phosphatase YidA [Pantoea agglomerans]|uniref:Phosphatase YidA n=1 Tax=Enterobacter agglomerans TaxID=549 RepID=A0A379A966_ENTAG|nr:Phosphatase YidA [Pantoea agglomerans]
MVSAWRKVTLTFDDYLYIENLARELGVHFQAFDKTHLYTPNKDISEYTIHEASLTGIPVRYRAVEEMDRAMRFPKLMMIDRPALLDAAIARLPGHAQQTLHHPEERALLPRNPRSSGE